MSHWLVAGVVAYGLVAYTVALGMVPEPEAFPAIDMEPRDGGSAFEVVQAEPGLEWESFTPLGCNRRPSGPVVVGDRLTGCAGSLVLQYRGA